MSWTTYKLELVTPAFIAGFDQQKAEIRVPSIRGQVRWWFRALGGTPQEETEIFGAVHGKVQRSRVMMRLRQPVFSGKAVNLEDLLGKNWMSHPQAYLLWPLRKQKRGLLPPGSGFQLDVAVSGDLSPSVAGKHAAALHAWILMGSLGTRSRRGFGSVAPARDPGDFPYPSLSTASEWSRALKQILGSFPRTRLKALVLSEAQPSADRALDFLGAWLKKLRCGSSEFRQTPSRWGEADHDAALGKGDRVYRPVIGLPLTQRFKDGFTIETKRGDAERWASPVHLKVISCGARFYPLAVIFPEMAMPEGTTVTLAGDERAPVPNVEKLVDWALLREMMRPETGDQVLWDSTRL